MAIIFRVEAAYLFLVAIAVAAHLVLGELYADAVAIVTIWEILDYFMAGACVIAVSVFWHFVRQDYARGDGAVTRDWLSANLGLFVAAVVTLWFFNNWVILLTGTEPEAGYNTLWDLVDGIMPPVLAAAGCRAYREARRL